MDARTVEEWFPEFAKWLQGSLALPDWPRKQDPYWAELKRLLSDRRVTTAEAAEAVRAMFDGGEPVKFARDFPPALMGRVEASRRSEAARRAAAVASSAAETLAREEHQRQCESVWATLDEPSRDEWRGLVRRRLPFLARRGKALEALAMAWCAFPSDIPPEPVAPPEGFGEPLRRGEPKPLRRVLEHDRILDAPQPPPPDESS